MSSPEAEYIALRRVAKESVWMVDFLQRLDTSIHDTTMVNADNQGSMALARDPVFHDRSTHIDIQYHFKRDLIKEG